MKCVFGIHNLHYNELFWLSSKDSVGYQSAVIGDAGFQALVEVVADWTQHGRRNTANFSENSSLKPSGFS